MKKLNKKQKIIIFLVAFLIITPLIVLYILNEKGVFDTRSSASGVLSEELTKADLNGDDKITISDFSIWLSTYRAFKENNVAGYATMGDLDGDGSIKISDFIEWLTLWRKYKGTSQDGAPCVSNNDCLSNTCSAFYQDSDKDGYGDVKSIVLRCGNIAPSGYITDKTDCYDKNVNAKPSQTLCFTTDRGDGSYDYNCDGKEDRCDSITCTKDTECATGTCTAFYRDEDGDGYGNLNKSINICGNTSPSGYVTDKTDCYDKNANAKPAQTLCFATDRGDGSYDYNCNLKEDKCNSCYKIGSSGTNNMWCGIGGRCVETSEPATSVSTIACGSSGNEAVKITCYNVAGCTQKRPVTYYEGGVKCTMSCN